MSNPDPQARRPGWPLLAGVALVVVTVLAVVLVVGLKSRQPPGPPLPVYGTIPDFTLTNQHGAAVSLADLRGRVWVADIIFTRCAGPCPNMTRQMRQLQDALPPASQAQLVTLTTDPDFDTPAVLNTYAARFGADPKRWMFLTGSKDQIGKLAIDSLKLTAIEKNPGERESPADLFIHSTIFVIVDKRGQLRGVFETVGEGIDPRAVLTQILAAVKRLEREP
ncbi:MAG TPA: SCO family protein [Candidatus Paceibacterota bacterium]|nr:SCO family protein [Verrucomicrobiota bacterium]HSA11042.1 SCO family protein [Candidatus Paceibacterota bacterium]